MLLITRTVSREFLFCRGFDGLWLSSCSGVSHTLPGLSALEFQLGLHHKSGSFCFHHFVELLPLLSKRTQQNSLSILLFHALPSSLKPFTRPFSFYAWFTPKSKGITSALGFGSNNEIKIFLLWWPSGLGFLVLLEELSYTSEVLFLLR